MFTTQLKIFHFKNSVTKVKILNEHQNYKTYFCSKLLRKIFFVILENINLRIFAFFSNMTKKFCNKLCNKLSFLKNFQQNVFFILNICFYVKINQKYYTLKTLHRYLGGWINRKIINHIFLNFKKHRSSEFLLSSFK